MGTKSSRLASWFVHLNFKLNMSFLSSLALFGRYLKVSVDLQSAFPEMLCLRAVLKKITINCIITDRHPNPLFSVCIISANVKRKIMQTNCVRKTGAVFFGSREIIRGNLTRAKSTSSIIETRCIIKPKTSCIIKK